MDTQRSCQTSSATEADVEGAVVRRLPQYAVCVGLGLLAGAVGVALAIGLAIMVQLRLPPPTVFTPGVMPLMVTAILAGLCASWLIGQAVRYGLPDLIGDQSHNGTQVILVSSVFASLAQVLLFFM
jgi:hypothetical protein